MSRKQKKLSTKPTISIYLKLVGFSEFQTKTISQTEQKTGNNFNHTYIRQRNCVFENVRENLLCAIKRGNEMSKESPTNMLTITQLFICISQLT